ncbi:hypothetical protein [Spongiactinospora sp. TRM90649]|uniref:hypothetical protein n=1 Tax=Spongiactinospora sp. TRM90649 TaxID=3031114 RepID=UPI0023F698F3|nr:hypothetical protein [Spongiactinospora sp. TRM90649]MDF5753217.1 hypothetical protein [Spongiactinospora sp. TRM90649]
MTDPIRCPVCEGRDGEGDLSSRCGFCSGRGRVEGPGSLTSAEAAAWERGAWQDPAVPGASPCRYCLGAGQVVSLGGGGQVGMQITTGDCPLCAA